MKKQGFTLIELLIVVIIIGILATLAAPQFFRATERARAAEAYTILGTLRSAQIRYYTQQAVSTFATDCATLDVDWSGLKNFATPSCAGATAAGFVAFMTRSGGAYSLSINSAGTIACTGTCPAGVVPN